ncbi:MAG TPA: ferrous iron transport protein A [Candidatus Marinimicrobia bacterium]|nr:ferrous iron transport protein A [Candidatus Neomarinimicrobiota bacterium]
MVLEAAQITEVRPGEIPLNKMRQGQKGIISHIDGGHHFNQKIEAMGLHLGVSLEIISAQLMHGPVTVRVGSTQAAIGFGMAGKIYIKLSEQ